MQERSGNVNETTAPITNVALCRETLERAIDRPRHLPGMVVFYGPSGFGKSFAAAFAATSHRAYYVQCLSVMTRKSFLETLLQRMGITPEKTIAAQLEQVCEQLATSLRPLIVDEMDHLVDKAAVEIIRDIYERSRASILLIGEEQLPGKLRKWERFHGRILHWQPAQPADLNDAAHLRSLYVRPPVTVADDLLESVHRQAKGSVRRICVNLEMIQEEARENGWTNVDLATWGKRSLYTGEAPARRV